MSRPFKQKSHDGATSTGPGQKYLTRAHPNLGLLVIAENFNPTDDELEVVLEAGIERESGDVFGPIYDEGVEATITGNDLRQDADGPYVAFFRHEETAIESARANILSFTDGDNSGLTVDTIILTNGGEDAFSYQGDV